MLLLLMVVFACCEHAHGFVQPGRSCKGARDSTTPQKMRGEHSSSSAVPPILCNTRSRALHTPLHLPVSSMIRGVIIVNNHGKPRLVKFYQTVVRRGRLGFKLESDVLTESICSASPELALGHAALNLIGRRRDLPSTAWIGRFLSSKTIARSSACFSQHSHEHCRLFQLWCTATSVSCSAHELGCVAQDIYGGVPSFPPWATSSSPTYLRARPF